MMRTTRKKQKTRVRRQNIGLAPFVVVGSLYFLCMRDNLLLRKCFGQSALLLVRPKFAFFLTFGCAVFAFSIRPQESRVRRKNLIRCRLLHFKQSARTTKRFSHVEATTLSGTVVSINEKEDTGRSTNAEYLHNAQYSTPSAITLTPSTVNSFDHSIAPEPTSNVPPLSTPLSSKLVTLDSLPSFPATATVSVSNSADLIRERFHDDMRRVLESRRPLFHSHYTTTARNSRRHRPLVMVRDVDGAMRSLAMLRHLQSLRLANETSFQIVMAAFLQRGRLRWHDPTFSAATLKNCDGPKLSSKIDDSEVSTSFLPCNGSSKYLICAADQLELLFKDLATVIPASALSMETYNLVLEAYAVCSTPRGDRQYALHAHNLLKHMRESLGENVSVESELHVLHAYAWQQINLDQRDDSARHAQELLNKIALKTNNSAILMPALDWTLEAWSKSGAVERAKQADIIFNQMKLLNQTTTSTSSDFLCQFFNAETYSNVILVWAKAQSEDAFLAATRSNELLLEVLEKHKQRAFSPDSKPPLIAFNSVITAWGRVNQPERAHAVLRLLEEVSDSCDIVPDSVTYNSVLHAYLQRSPVTVKTLNNIIALTQYMEIHCLNRPSIRPNSFTYYTLLKSWIQCRPSQPEAATFAEKALQQIEKLWKEGDREVFANNRLYNMVINAYAKSNHPDVCTKAFDLLHRIKASEHNLTPDQFTYTSILECLSKSFTATAPRQAEDLLNEATELFNETKNPAHMPNARMYTMVILTLAKNNGSVRTARNLLTRLVQLYETSGDPQLKPTEHAYNYVLNCASNMVALTATTTANSIDNDNVCNGKNNNTTSVDTYKGSSISMQQEAFRIATATYQEMRKSKLGVRPDSFTYAFWIKCCNNLLPEGSDLRNKCIAYAFDECKQAGLVSQEVLFRLLQGSSPEMVQNLLELNRDPIIVNKDANRAHRFQRRFQQSQGPQGRSRRQLSYRNIHINDLPRSWTRYAV